MRRDEETHAKMKGKRLRRGKPKKEGGGGGGGNARCPEDNNRYLAEKVTGESQGLYGTFLPYISDVYRCQSPLILVKYLVQYS